MQGLVEALNDNGYYVRSNAAKALGQLIVKTSDVMWLLKTAHSKIYEILSTGCTPELVQNLVEALQDNDVNVRNYAAWALGLIEVSTPEVLQSLSIRLNDSDPIVCYNAALALVKIKSGTPEALRIVVQALKDNDTTSICLSAARALGELKANTPELLKTLMDLLNKNICAGTNSETFSLKDLISHIFGIIDEFKNDFQENYALIEEALLQRRNPTSVQKAAASNYQSNTGSGYAAASELRPPRRQ